MTLMLAAASIKVMDALFGLVAQNDAEWSGLELLGRSWRRDWGMHNFRPENVFWRTLIFTGPVKMLGICAWLNLDVLGVQEGLVYSIGILEAPGVFLARRWRRC